MSQMQNVYLLRPCQCSGVLVLAITSHRFIQNSSSIPAEQNFSRTEKGWELKGSDGLSEMQQEGKAGEIPNPLPGPAIQISVPAETEISDNFMSTA